MPVPDPSSTNNVQNTAVSSDSSKIPLKEQIKAPEHAPASPAARSDSPSSSSSTPLSEELPVTSADSLSQESTLPLEKLFRPAQEPLLTQATPGPKSKQEKRFLERLNR